MAAGSMNLQGIVGRLGASQLAAPILIIMVLAMMVLPLPPFLLDILFTFNIAVAVLVLMVAVDTKKRWIFRCFRPCCWSPRCCVWRSTWLRRGWC